MSHGEVASISPADHWPHRCTSELSHRFRHVVPDAAVGRGHHCEVSTG
jgi:hypothetical protein